MLYPSGTLEDWPGHFKTEARLRVRESNAARKTLLTAAALCLIRVMIMPWLMHWSPAGTFAGPTEAELVQDGLICFGVFAFSAIVSGIVPIVSVLISMLVFAGLATQDFLAYQDVLAAGVISKTVTGLLLIRALMNAILSRTV